MKLMWAAATVVLTVGGASGYVSMTPNAIEVHDAVVGPTPPAVTTTQTVTAPPVTETIEVPSSPATVSVTVPPVTETVTVTEPPPAPETVTQTETIEVVSLPESCADALKATDKIHSLATQLDSSFGTQLDIISQARIEIAEQDHLALSGIEKRQRAYQSKTTGRSIDLYNALADYTDAIDQCKEDTD